MRVGYSISRKKNVRPGGGSSANGGGSVLPNASRSCWMMTFLVMAFVLAAGCILVFTNTINTSQFAEIERQYMKRLRSRGDPMDFVEQLADLAKLPKSSTQNYANSNGNIILSNSNVNSNKGVNRDGIHNFAQVTIPPSSTSLGSISQLQQPTSSSKTSSTTYSNRGIVVSRSTDKNGAFVQATIRKKIAFAITINKDGPFHDGAAVLAYSIIRSTANRDYDISFIAFVHPTVVTSRPMLAKLGYHVIESTTPINVSAIKYQFLREKINLNGCCGASELIKLNSYRLLQYHRIIHLDADTMLLQDIDELLDREFSLIYTTDPNMATHKGEDKMPVQGGFIVLRPNMQDYRNIIETLMTTEFLVGGGWNRSKIGWFWGGMTVQGILPYYYNRVTAPNRSQIIDRCIYNTMADSDECLKRSISEVKSAHFTVCQKPWMCYKTYYNGLCEDLHKSWFQLRRDAETYFGLTPTVACPGKAGGPNNYVQMDLHKALLPYSAKNSNSLPGSKARIVPDESPSVIDPTEESRYISKAYDNIVGGHKNKGEKRL